MSHENELKDVAVKLALALDLSKDDYFIEYWEDEDSAIFSTFEFNIVIRPNDDKYILETSFYLSVHPNLAASVAMTLSKINNVQVELFEGYEYSEEGDMVFENDLDNFELDEENSTIH